MQPETVRETWSPLAVWGRHQGSTKPISSRWDDPRAWSPALWEALIQTLPELWGRLKARLGFVSYSLWGWEMREQTTNFMYHITPACLNQPTPPTLPQTAGQTHPELIKAHQTSERLRSGTIWMDFQVPPWIEKCKWFYRESKFLTYIYTFRVVQPREDKAPGRPYRAFQYLTGTHKEAGGTFYKDV